jgi:hypothetical protein
MVKVSDPDVSRPAWDVSVNQLWLEKKLLSFDLVVFSFLQDRVNPSTNLITIQSAALAKVLNRPVGEVRNSIWRLKKHYVMASWRNADGISVLMINPDIATAGGEERRAMHYRRWHEATEVGTLDP